jgi:hypothetical protein
MSVTASNGVAYNTQAYGATTGAGYYDNLLTNYFLQLLPDARNNSTVLLSMIDKRPHQAVSGKYIVFPVRFGRSTGLNNVGYGGVIPDPGFQPSLTYSTITRKGMARIALDGDTIRHGKTNGGAYAEALQIEMEGIVDDIMIDRARQVHNDGSGRIAEVNTIGSTTPDADGCISVTLKVNSSIEGAATTRAAGTLDKYIEPGMRVAVFTNAGAIQTFTPNTGPIANAFTVFDVTVSGATVTVRLRDALNVALASGVGAFSANWANAWVVRCGNGVALGTAPARVDTAYRREMTGIGGVFTDVGVLNGMGASGSQQSAAEDDIGTATSYFQGILASSQAFNRAVVLDNGGAGNRPLTEELMQQAMSDAEEINNANIELILSSFPTYNSYVKLLTPDKRYNNTLELQGGHKTLTFNGVGWVKDRFCYQNRVYFLALDQFHILETAPMQPLVGGDVTTWERLPDLDKYWRGWTWEDNMIVEVRNRTGAVLTELSS